VKDRKRKKGKKRRLRSQASSTENAEPTRRQGECSWKNPRGRLKKGRAVGTRGLGRKVRDLQPGEQALIERLQQKGKETRKGDI